MAPLSIHIKESHIKSRNALHTILRRPLATSCQPLVPPTTDHQPSNGPPDSKQTIITCPLPTINYQPTLGLPVPSIIDHGESK